MVIREATLYDAQRLLEIYSYYVLNTAISFEIITPSLGEFEKRIQSTLKGFPYLVLEDNGMIQGYAYAGPFRTRPAYRYSCELSIYLDKDAKGNGYGRKLYEELEKQLKSLGIKNLYACVTNPIEEDEHLTRNSEQFHEHMGFIKVGEFHRCGYKFDRWYNMIYMEKLL